MPSLKDLRNRISSVKATQKITKAMQMVAAAKLRRAQAAAEAARPYAERMEGVLANLAAGYQLVVRNYWRAMGEIIYISSSLRPQNAGFAGLSTLQSCVWREKIFYAFNRKVKQSKLSVLAKKAMISFGVNLKKKL